MRVLGLDYGSTTCGIAVSDESETIASPVDTIRYKEKEELFTKLDEYIEKYKPCKIVLGNPINLDGSISKRSEETFFFKFYYIIFHFYSYLNMFLVLMRLQVCLLLFFFYLF